MMTNHPRLRVWGSVLALLALSACASDQPAEDGDATRSEAASEEDPSVSIYDGPAASASRATVGPDVESVTSAGPREADAGTGLPPSSGGTDVQDRGEPGDAGVCDPIPILESELTTGAACPKGTSDRCGGGRIVGSCSWDNHYCNKGVIWESSSERLDCAAGALFASTPSSAAWTTCETALEVGRTGATCDFVGSCTRATEDACCIETASCGLLHQEHHLYRYRVCTPGCKNVRADAAQERVTRCTGGDMTAKLGAACKPGLVCIAGGEPAQTGALSYYSSSIVFCAGGVLLGNPNAFLPFL